MQKNPVLKQVDLKQFIVERSSKWAQALCYFAAAGSVALAGCGGGGGSSSDVNVNNGSGSSGSVGSSPSLSLSGTAAVGLALANASVSAKCATGSQTSTTSANGNFSLAIPNGAGPCVLEVDSGPSSIVTINGTIAAHTKYHGYVGSSEIVDNGGGSTKGTVNITPFTEEVLRLALGSVSPGTFYGQTTVTSLSIPLLDTAQSKVIARLVALGATTTGITSLRTQAFTAATSVAASTDPIDGALDLAVVAGSFTVPAPTGTFAAQIKVNDYQNSGSTISGVVSCSDATKGVGTTCTSTGQAPGTAVSLTANPVTGYGVTWSGACAGTSGNTCNLTLNSDKVASVSFDPKGSTIWWVSKTGSDSNTGRTPGTAFATFRKALTTMAGGDTLYIDDGTYGQSIGGYGGEYSVWDTAVCTALTALPPCKVTSSGARNEGPNGTDAAHRTKILGYRSHAVTVDPSGLASGKRIGLVIFKGQHIEVGNIVFKHTRDMGPVHIEQANDIYLHQIGAAYADPVNNADNNRSNFYIGDSNLVVLEESWGWGYGARYGIVLHGGTNNIARRNVLRYDGAPDGNPKAGISLYSEDASIAENNVVVDFNGDTDSTADVHAPLFTTSSVALSSPSLVTGLGSVSWYGNIAVNTVGQTNGNFFFDSLTSIGGTLTVIDNVIAGVGTAGGTTDAGLWLSNDNGTQHSVVLQKNTIYNSRGAGIRIDAPPRWSAIAISNNLVNRATSLCVNDLSGIGSRITASNNQVFGCSGLAVPKDASVVTSNPSLSYLTQATTAAGATVVNRYASGTLTGTALWPFPNETFIRQDMCAGPDTGTTSGSTIYTRTHNTTGWCGTSKSLTKYVWEQIGGTSPY